MQNLLKNLIKLLLSLILINNISYGETTQNLVSQNFTTGWSGTNLSSMHGSTTIAGVDSGYVQSDNVSLNSSNINKESLNQGFTITGSANYWFWSGAQQSVTQTIKTVDDNGNIITQTRVVSGTSGSGTTYDQLIIGSNSQQDYNVSLRYDFSVPQYPMYHYAADLSNPSLTVSYTYVAPTPPLDTTTQTALLDLNTTMESNLQEIKTDKLTVSNINTLTTDNTTEPTPMTTSTLTSNDQNSTSTTPTQESQSTTESTQSSTENKEEQKTVTSEKSAETSSPTKTETNQSQQSETQSTTLSSANNINEVKVEVKDPAKNMQIKSLEKLEAMIDNSMLSAYNVPFYKEKKIYENQIHLVDNRVIYQNNLSVYMERDPIFIQQSEVQRLRNIKEQLIRELRAIQ